MNPLKCESFSSAIFRIVLLVCVFPAKSVLSAEMPGSSVMLSCKQIGTHGPGGLRILEMTFREDGNGQPKVAQLQEFYKSSQKKLIAQSGCERRNKVSVDDTSGSIVRSECSGELVRLDTDLTYGFSLWIGRDPKGAYLGTYSFDKLANGSSGSLFTPMWAFKCESI